MSLNRSRQGLTRCRTCRAHILTAARPSQTICPFCGENQLGLSRERARSKIVSVGRGGLLAASLLAFSAVGCEESGEAPSVEIVEPAVEPLEADPGAQGEPEEPEATVTPPRPNDAPGADEWPAEPAPAMPPVARYGLPPMRNTPTQPDGTDPL